MGGKAVSLPGLKFGKTVYDERSYQPFRITHEALMNMTYFQQER